MKRFLVFLLFKAIEIVGATLFVSAIIGGIFLFIKLVLLPWPWWLGVAIRYIMFTIIGLFVFLLVSVFIYSNWEMAGNVVNDTSDDSFIRKVFNQFK